jgi:hypothetical protein
VKGRIRSFDLQVMSLTSYRAAPSRVTEKIVSNLILKREQGNYSEAKKPFCANFVPVRKFFLEVQVRF